MRAAGCVGGCVRESVASRGRCARERARTHLLKVTIRHVERGARLQKQAPRARKRARPTAASARLEPTKAQEALVPTCLGRQQPQHASCPARQGAENCPEHRYLHMLRRHRDELRTD
eukprot:2513744-Pleurochrysis_carterae.AAC.1